MGVTLRRITLVLLLGAGCTQQGETHANATAGVTRHALIGANHPACPKTGHWTECQLFTRLEQAGVAPRRAGGAKDLPRLGPASTIYSIGTATLATYFFPDTTTRARAARTLDTLHFISPGASLTTRGEATAIQNDNLLALLYSRSDQQRERVSDALMAGAPQP